MSSIHVVPLLFGPSGIHGGAERYAYEMAHAMARRCPTSLVTFGAEPGVTRDGELRVRVIKPFAYPRQSHLKTKTNPLSVRPLLEELASARRVFCHQQNVLVSTIAGIHCRLRGVPVFAIPLGGSGWDLSSYVSTDRLFTGILHISEYSRRLQGHGKLARAHVVYAGVSPRKFFADPSVRKDGSVLFVGRLLPHKGIEVLIEALTAGMSCVVAGTRKDENYYSQLQRLAIGKSVEFREQVSDDDLRLLYQRACAVVLPSVSRDLYGRSVPWTELFGQTLIEGMACGTPAIASNVAALPEVVEDGRTGFLFPERGVSELREILTRLRDRESLVRELGERAQEAVRSRFTWDAVLDRCDAMAPAR